MKTIKFKVIAIWLLLGSIVNAQDVKEKNIAAPEPANYQGSYGRALHC